MVTSVLGLVRDVRRWSTLWSGDSFKQKRHKGRPAKKRPLVDDLYFFCYINHKSNIQGYLGMWVRSETWKLLCELHWWFSSNIELLLGWVKIQKWWCKQYWRIIMLRVADSRANDTLSIILGRTFPYSDSNNQAWASLARRFWWGWCSLPGGEKLHHLSLFW